MGSKTDYALESEHLNQEMSPAPLVLAVHIIWLDILVSAPYIRFYLSSAGSRANLITAGLASVSILLTLATVGGVIPACIRLGKYTYKENIVYDDLLQEMVSSLSDQAQLEAVLAGGVARLGQLVNVHDSGSC